MATDNVQKTIGYHNLTLEELINEVITNGDELSRALLDKMSKTVEYDDERLKRIISEYYK